MTRLKRVFNVFSLLVLAAIGVMGITLLGGIVMDTAPPTGAESALAVSRRKVTLVFTICEKYFTNGLATIKSAVAYSTTPLHLVVIADDHNQEKMQKEYISWPATIRERVTCDVRPLWFPKEDYQAWHSMLRLCSTQKLFLPSMLPNVDAVLYVDTDAVFVHPIEDFWRLFYAMNKWQMAGMAPETENCTNNYYLKKAGLPYVKPFALQTGLLLMNLTRMRRYGLDDLVFKLRREFQDRIRYADQDLLNIVFARYRQGLFTFTCRWNFRAEHCQGNALCTDGPIAVIHGSRTQGLEKFEPGFVAVTKAMLRYKLGESLVEHFIIPLNKSLGTVNVTGCTKAFKEQMPLWRLSASRVDNATARNSCRATP